MAQGTAKATNAVKMDDLKEQINKLQAEIEEKRKLLNQKDEEGMLRQELKEHTETNDKEIDEFQHIMDDPEEVAIPRHSERKSVPTEKFLAYQREEQSKKEKRLLSFYEQWKIQIRSTKENLKQNTSDMELAKMADTVENGKDNIMKMYFEIRQSSTPTADLRRKIDACEAVTQDIMRIINERISGIDDVFDAERERHKLRELYTHNYAQSIYGSASQSTNSHHTETSVAAAKRAEAVAELAAKEAQCKLMEEERKQKEKIRMMESELERLQAERDREVARVRLESYDREIRLETDSHPLQQIYSPPAQRRESRYDRQNPAIPIVHHQNRSIGPPNPHTDISSLAQAIQDSITINRLPMPMPTVFGGDPIHYIEWRASFMSLIDRKSISSADKLYYLKKYVTGSAHKCIEGTFYRNDAEAYRDAWDKLNQRYGQPFVIQRAFRDKLSKWPRVQTKDAEGLRAFSDFLNACLQAMSHVRGLEILNDCEENQKLMHKVPDWLAARWNRQVSIALMEGKDFPSFEEFARFVSVEAEIACNPITSLHAVHSSSSSYVKRNTNENRGSKVSVFSTQTDANSENTRSNYGKEKPPCMWCKDDQHQLPRCSKFKEKSLEERRTFIKDNKLCYGCVKPGHNAKECRHRHTCELCKGRHPTCLHNENYKKSDEKDRPVSMEGSKIAANVNTASNCSNQVVTASPLCVTKEGQSYSTSMIVPVWISSATQPSKEHLVYALLDTQSDSTFIEREVSDELQPNTFPVQLKLTTMLGESMTMKSERVEGLRVRGYNSSIYIDLPPSYTKDCIPMNRDNIPTHQTAKQWPHLAAIKDLIPPLLNCDVGLLIGYNCPRAIKPKQLIDGADNEPYAVLTDLGWSIVGCSTPGLNERESSMCHRVTVKELPSVTPMDVISVLESDFKDTKGDDKTVSQEDLAFLSTLKDGIKKNAQGHYEMPLPFRKRPSLPDNKRLAEIRLNHLRRKFSRDEKYQRDYTTYMKEIIERGDVEEGPTNGTRGEQWYIPHHGIYHPQKPDKLRVVFDCSAKYCGTSLNEHLLPGPDMINNLTGILIRFRRHPIALLCDIEKMFHQFHVQKEDRNYLRFLWWKDGDTTTQPQEYRMKVHLFGAVSSPGCANYGLKYLAKEHSLSHPVGAQFVAKDFYVDDGVTSADSVEEAIQLAQEAREICSRGGLRLHKFVSNNHAVLQSLPPSECATETKTKDLPFNNTLERALGIQWSIKEDSFKFNYTVKNQPATRRGILSTVASIYDPLGFLAPYVLNGKKILQEICNQGIGWDEPLPERLKPRWESWQRDLINLQKVNITRCYLPANFGEVMETELHHFSDASTCGYGQCSYLRVKNKEGKIHCSLVIGKARVSPTKLTTIPRLELTAAAVSVSISNMLREELRVVNGEEYFWTDSKVVLGYINNDARRFHTFVANRVQKIRNSTNPKQWRYVPTDENPADGASRGKTINELLTSDWFTGPTFLWKKELPMKNDAVPDLSIGDPEVKKKHKPCKQKPQKQ